MDDEERLVSSELLETNRESEQRLRPLRLSEYVGQTKIKERLNLFINAARQRKDSLDHVLIAGPPGLGKTTLAHIISAEMGTQIHVMTGPNVEKKGDLAAVLTNLQPGDVLFIDEIHRLHKAIEEVLYSAMEDYRLDIIIGQGPAAKTLKIDLPKFTLVGATTRSGLLSGPLRDRFGIQLRLDFYPEDELQQIVERSSSLLKITADASGSNEIAKRARGTPRIANRLLKRVRDFAQVKRPEKKCIDREIAKAGLKLLEIDERGLDAMDRKYLMMIIEKFDGGPVGIETLSSALGEERDTLEDIYEPFMLQQGLIQRTPRGRLATPSAFSHLGVVWENPSQKGEAAQPGLEL